MARPPLLKPTPSGVYYRQVGYLPSGSQPRFNLGTDRVNAVARNARLEEVWRITREMAVGINQEPVWDETSIAIARAVAEGATRFVVGLNPSMSEPDSYLHWVARYATAYGGIIPVIPQQPELYAEGEALESSRRREFLVEAVRHAEIAYPTFGEAVRLPTGQTTSQALDAFREQARAKHRGQDGAVTEWGEVLSDQITFLRRHTPNLDLCEFGLAAIESVVETLSRRPPSLTRTSKGLRPITRSYAKTITKTFRHFLRWLHRAEEFRWRFPADYQADPVRIVRTDAERASAVRATQVATYSLDEMVLLWAYAAPIERLFILLALNCGFGKRELATLQTDELRLRQAHPNAATLGLSDTDTASWIMRLRGKTDVYGEWQLWPLTVAAIEWYASRRPHSQSPYFLLNGAGRPFTTRTKGNNGNAGIANFWGRLTARIRKDHPNFRSLSFNKLRKTGQNYLRTTHDAEVASVYAGHGKPFPEDDLIEVYTNKPFARMHTSVIAFGRWLQPVWDRVASPFPANWTEVSRRGGPNITRGVIERINELYLAGRKITDIGRELNLSRETVRRWVKREL